MWRWGKAAKRLSSAVILNCCHATLPHATFAVLRRFRTCDTISDGHGSITDQDIETRMSEMFSDRPDVADLVSRYEKPADPVLALVSLPCPALHLPCSMSRQHRLSRGEVFRFRSLSLQPRD